MVDNVSSEIRSGWYTSPLLPGGFEMRSWSNQTVLQIPKTSSVFLV